MSNIDRESIFQKRINEEKDSEDQCYWLSFCDTEKTAGQQFNGVVITWAKGVAHAIEKSWSLGINPGGQVMSYVTDPFDIDKNHFDRLLSKQKLIDYGYIDA